MTRSDEFQLDTPGDKQSIAIRTLAMQFALADICRVMLGTYYKPRYLTYKRRVSLHMASK